MPETSNERLTVLAFLAMIIGIAGNVVAVRYLASEGDLDPLWAAASRFLLATLIFAALAGMARATFPRGRALTGAVLYGLLSIGGFFALMYWGLQETPASTAGVILATNPLMTFLLALLHRVERFRWDSMLGSAIVVAGTAVVLGEGLGAGVPVWSLLAVLAAAACAAEGAVVIKRFPRVDPSMRNAIAMGVSTVLLLVLMVATGESASLPVATSTWVAQAYLVTFGTVGVFGLYLYILARWSASAVAFEFVAAPPLAILFAWLVFDEQISGPFAIGSALVLVGVYLGAIRPVRARAGQQIGSEPQVRAGARLES